MYKYTCNNCFHFFPHTEEGNESAFFLRGQSTPAELAASWSLELSTTQIPKCAASKFLEFCAVWTSRMNEVFHEDGTQYAVNDQREPIHVFGDHVSSLLSTVM